MSNRFISLGVALSILFCGVLGKTAYIIFSGAYTVSDNYNSYSLTVDVNEPQLYYSDGTKINNNIKEYRAVIRPVTNDLAELQRVYTQNEISEITDELKDGYPVVRDINNTDTSLRTLATYSTDTDLSQLISMESSGLLKYIHGDSKKLTVNYLVDAKGRLLSGDNGTVYDSAYLSRDGYVLTIDKKIQEIAYNATSELKSGCVIIMDATTSQILACVNKPDDTYMNKAFSQYSVGSVFKLVTAACAIQNGYDYHYMCSGSTVVGDTIFSCQKKHAHGFENLESALSNSCNCYFINLTLELGEEKLYETAKAFGFDASINLYSDWQIRSSVLPNKSALYSKGQLALFGFGQGSLTASPLQICSVLCTISNEGKYISPSVVKARKEKNGSLTEYPITPGEEIISKDTSETLLKYMRSVVSEGTAINADTPSHKSAGKTATAQTGQYKNGTEIYNTWFAGVYPYDKPKYCIVIMCEDGTSGAADCCPIFRTVIENIEKS